MIKKNEYIDRILEIIKKDLERILPEEEFLYEYQEQFADYVKKFIERQKEK